MDKILEMSKEINYNNLVYHFEGPTNPINFAIFDGPVYTYDQLKNGDTTLQKVKNNKNILKKN